MRLDEALSFLGNYGKYQTLAFVFLCAATSVFASWQMMTMVFITDKPAGYQCKSPLPAGMVSNGSYYANVTGNQLPEDGAPTMPSEVAECFVNTSESGDQAECTEWDYHFNYGEKTIVSDFDLVCDRALLPNTAQSIFFVGVLVGSLVNGALSDIYGRKRVLIAASFLVGVFGICLTFTWSYTGFVALWFLVGVFEQGINVTGFVLIMEMFIPEKRTLPGCLTGVAWGMGVALVSPFAYFLRDWRHMQIAFSVPPLIAAVLMIGVTVESVRWLVSKGRLEAAEKILHRIARLNNINAPDKFLTDNDDVFAHIATEPSMKYAPSDINENDGHSEDTNLNTNNDDGRVTEIKMAPVERPLPSGDKFRLTDLRKSPQTIRNAFIMFYSWSVSSMVYYGMALNSSNLAGDKYLNFFLLGLIEIPGYLSIYFLIEWWGRRPSLSLTHFVAGLSSVICACLPAATADGTDLTPAILAFALIGKFGVTISYGIDFIYGSEIFPTPIRNIGVGSSSFFARIGGIVAPFVVYLADVSPHLPLNVFGVVSLIAAGLVLVLPETARRPLPETMAEGEELARSAIPPQLPSCLRLGRKRKMDGKKYQPAQATA